MPSESAAGPGPFDVVLGGRLQQFRQRAHLSVTDLAAAIGVTPISLKRYESGASRAPVAALVRAARALECPPSAFFGEARLAPTDLGEEVARLLAEPGAQTLLQHYAGLPRGLLRKSLVDLVRTWRDQSPSST